MTFYGCSSITSIVASSATSLMDDEFYQCTLLTSLDLSAEGSFTYTTNAFRNFANYTSSCTLTLHSDKFDSTNGVTPQASEEGASATWATNASGNALTWKEIVKKIDEN